MRLSSCLLAVSFVALSACAAGPDFQRPEAPADASFGAAQSVLPERDIPAEWWQVFHSEPLNQLIKQALVSNPDLAAAEAALRAAAEDAASGESILYPSATASFTTTRQKTTGASNGGKFQGSIYTLHNASVGVSYGIDLFGGSRRSIEGLEAQQESLRFQREATYLSLTGNLVTAAIQEASLRGQIESTKAMIAAADKQQDLLRQQLELGAVAKTVVLTQQAARDDLRAALPPLENTLSQIRHQMAALAGQMPDRLQTNGFTLADLTMPSDLPRTLPSRLVEQRPDIRGAEADLHAASAAIGVAEARRLPHIDLSANIGDVANNLGRMFLPGTGIWSAGADLSQSLFDAGKLRHAQRATEARYDAAAAVYRKTVLAAFQDVADTLRALQSDADTLATRQSAEQAAAEHLKLVRDRFEAGAIGYTDILDAEQSAEQATLGRIKAEAQRLANTAALFQALGGGWWNRAEASPELDAAVPSPSSDSTTAETADSPESAIPAVQAWRHQ